jgi:hypothetical protein
VKHCNEEICENLTAFLILKMSKLDKTPVNDSADLFIVCVGVFQTVMNFTNIFFVLCK